MSEFTNELYMCQLYVINVAPWTFLNSSLNCKPKKGKLSASHMSITSHALLVIGYNNNDESHIKNFGCL